MRILRTVLAFAIITVAWWSMAEAIGTASLLQATMPHALLEPVPASRLDDLIYFDHPPSMCCSDFDAAMALSVVGTLLGGFPMAGLAFVVRRRATRSLTSAAQPWVIAAFVYQCAAMILAGLIVAAFLWSLSDAPGYVWADLSTVTFLVYMVLTAVVSAWALSAWHNLHARIEPNLPIALKSEG